MAATVFSTVVSTGGSSGESGGRRRLGGGPHGQRTPAGLEANWAMRWKMKSGNRRAARELWAESKLGR
jgi:hypothetical protein